MRSLFGVLASGTGAPFDILVLLLTGISQAVACFPASKQQQSHAFTSSAPARGCCILLHGASRAAAVRAGGHGDMVGSGASPAQRGGVAVEGARRGDGSEGPSGTMSGQRLCNSE